MTAPPRCPFRPRSLFVAGHHQFMVEVKFCPWDGKYYATNAQSTSVTHTPPCPLLASPKPWVIHEPLPCETEWPTQAKLTSRSVLMEPFITATSCMSASAANSLGSDRGVSSRASNLLSHHHLPHLQHRHNAPFLSVRVSHFVLPAICLLGMTISGFCERRPKKEKKKRKRNKSVSKHNWNQESFESQCFQMRASFADCVASASYLTVVWASQPANSRLFHRSAHRCDYYTNYWGSG